MKDRIIAWFRTYRERCLGFLGLILVGGLCFEAGLLQGNTGKEVVVQFSVPPLPIMENQVSSREVGSPTESVSTVGEILQPVNQKITEKPPQDCRFVGSKNSTKYHLATCAVARRIKLENRVCFASQEEAQKRGYVPSCLK